MMDAEIALTYEQCMTCDGATPGDLATEMMLYGSIPLCVEHAELMRETIADAEWLEKTLGVP